MNENVNKRKTVMINGSHVEFSRIDTRQTITEEVKQLCLQNITTKTHSDLYSRFCHLFNVDISPQTHI